MPFFGTTAQITFGHLYNDPNLEQLPPPERAIVKRALAKKPEERWPDCRSFIAALENVGTLHGRPVPETLPRDPQDPESQPESPADSSVPPGFPLSASSTDLGPHDSDDPVWPRSGEGRIGHDAALPTGASFLDHSWGPDAFFSVESIHEPREVEDNGRHANPRESVRPGKATRLVVKAAFVSALGLVLLTRGVWLRAARPHVAATATDVPTAAMAEPPRPEVGPHGSAIDQASSSPTPEAPAPLAGMTPATTTTTTSEAPILSAPGSSEPTPESPVATVFVVPDGQASGTTTAAVSAPKEVALANPKATRSGSTVGSLRVPDLIAPLLAPSPPAAEPAKIEVPSQGSGGDLGRNAEADRDAQRVEAPSLTLPANVSVLAGESTKLRVRVARGDASKPVHLDFRGLPRGITLEDATIPAGTDTAEINLKASAQAPPGSAEVAVAFSTGADRGEARVTIQVRSSQASVDYERGRADLSRGAYAQAVAAFSEAIQHDPDSFGAHFHRGIANYLRGRYREALTDYSIAIRLQPGYADAFLVRARVHLDLGETRDALADYTEAIRLRPDASTYLARGSLEHEMGAYDRALADYEVALRLRPDYPAAPLPTRPDPLLHGREQRGHPRLHRGHPARSQAPRRLSLSLRRLRPVGGVCSRRRGSRYFREARSPLRRGRPQVGRSVPVALSKPQGTATGSSARGFFEASSAILLRARRSSLPTPRSGRASTL